MFTKFYFTISDIRLEDRVTPSNEDLQLVGIGKPSVLPESKTGGWN